MPKRQSYLNISNMNQSIVPSVNFHLWQPCNMRCKFCFAGFADVKATVLPRGHLPKQEALILVERLAEFGLSKISFAGGEPTLCPWLMDLVAAAKSFGMATMLITNGSRLKMEYFTKLQGILDWVVLSIDSVVPETNFISGRKIGSKDVITEKEYWQKICLLHEFGFRLKINTVVHRYNYAESLKAFIEVACPERWKVMRMLPIEGQNDKRAEQMEINDAQFQLFIENNRIENHTIDTIVENNSDMKGSYLMIDPAGRFFDNVAGKHSYSPPILEIGVEQALSYVSCSMEKFINRGGWYNW